MNKRLIEYNLLLADISEASVREKSIRHGPPIYPPHLGGLGAAAAVVMFSA